MLWYNDKFNVSFINIKNCLGKILPITKEDICVVFSSSAFQDIASVDVYECQEHEHVSTGYCAFRILVGEVMTLKEAITKGNSCLAITTPLDFGLNDLVCCHTMNDQVYAFAQVLPGDVVVSNITELRDTILDIQGEALELKQNAKNIRSRSYIPYK